MKKTFTLGFLVMVLATVLTGDQVKAEDQPWMAPLTAASVKNPLEFNKDTIAMGKKVFETQCFVCHGSGGKGDGLAASGLGKPLPDFTSVAMWNQTDGELFWKLTNGNAPMPTFGPILPETERWATINFLRSLAPTPKEKSGE